MKKNIRFFIGLIISIAIIFILAQLLGRLLDPYEAGDGFAAIDAFHSLDENSMDVIVYGSSHAWKGCDTRVMYDEYGLKAYNYGCDWQAINTTLLFIRDSLRTQSPKVVCVETFMVNGLMKDWDMEGQIYYTKAISDFPGKREYIEQCFGDKKERYLSYYVPIVMFHDNWSVISSENFKKYDSGKYILSRGYNPSDYVVECDEPDYRSFEEKEIYEDCKEELRKIVAECKENNIYLIFYTAPYSGEYTFAEEMEKFAEESGCDYINLFEHVEEMGFDYKRDLRDAEHLNDSGSGKVASYLAEYIISNSIF